MASGENERGALQPYSVGGATPPGARRLHLNEFRSGHPASVLAAARAVADSEASLSHYRTGPDPRLVERLAEYVGRGAGDVLVTAGSDEALRAIVDTERSRGRSRVLMGVPGYTHFQHFVRLAGLGLTEYSIGLGTAQADHLAALRYYSDMMAEGCLVYLCSPNNPTGDIWAGGDVRRLAGEFPRSLFLVDEAYAEYAEAELALRGAGAGAGAKGDDSRVSVVRDVADCGNVVVTRTLSKAFGLAGVRVGYAVGRPPLLESVRVAVNPKAPGHGASVVAAAALGELDYYRQVALTTRREAAKAVAWLRGRGWWALDTWGNFYLVHVGATRARVADVIAALQAHGVVVRDRSDQPGLAGFVRVTAGTAEDTEAVVAAFAQLAPPAARPYQLAFTAKGLVAQIKTLTRRLMAALAAHAPALEVFAQSGTMLGMLRHGGMIPSDDDADLAYVLPTNAAGEAAGPDPFAALVEPLRALGLTVQRNRTDAYWQVGTNPPGAVISPVHVDVFSYALVGGQYLLGDPRFRDEDPASPQAHCNTRYSPDELFPLRCDYRFYDVAIPMPAKPFQVLNRALGSDYMKVMRARTPDGLLEVLLTDFSAA